MDRGYDNNRVYDECHARRIALGDPAPQGPRAAGHADQARNQAWGAALYRRRSAVEREFGNLEHNFGLAFLRVRGIDRVRLHADSSSSRGSRSRWNAPETRQTPPNVALYR